VFLEFEKGYFRFGLLFSTIPEKWLNSHSNQYTSRFEVPTERDSMVRIPPPPMDRVNESVLNGNNKIMGRRGFEPPGPAMSRRYPNQARPPAQYTMKKFVAQIYVVDRL
jgi:hypothetical protein